MERSKRSRDARIADLEVYFALNQFERRKPYKHLERGLQRDIKHFFGDYRTAQSAGFDLLTRIADVEAIERACQQAAEHGLGWLESRADGSDAPVGRAAKRCSCRTTIPCPRASRCSCT